MPNPPRSHPAAQPHGALVEVLPDLFFVTGTMSLPGPLPVRFSRNMTVARRGERLIVINSVRLDDDGLAALDRLGKVTDVLRLAANHGMDDPFYAERYGANVSVVKGQRYTSGLDTSSLVTYFTPDHELTGPDVPALPGARLVTIGSSPPEGLLLLPEHGGVMVSGDCLQNWAAPDEHFSWLAKPMMKVMGFLRPHNIGPGWLKRGKPPKADLRAVLDHDFANVLPAHGTPVLGGARGHFQPALERAST